MMNEKRDHVVSTNTKLQSRNIGYERLKPKANYLVLPPPTNNTPVSTGACCGIGHRLVYNILTFVYSIHQLRPVHVAWSDVPWSALFNDTIHIHASNEKEREHYDNGFPKLWNDGVTYGWVAMPEEGTSHGHYKKVFQLLFDMPLAHSIAKSLQDNLSSLVLSFLTSIREQSYLSELHLCVHVREGNNETGDWGKKSWRHIDLSSTLNATLSSMEHLAKSRNASNVSVFVASDNNDSRKWFQDHVVSTWTVIQPQKILDKPESGVWFGDYRSKTNSVLNQDQKNEAMAEAVSDIFALGECDALFIPNYSSFTLISIMLMRAERRIVSFLRRETLNYTMLPYIY